MKLHDYVKPVDGQAPVAHPTCASTDEGAQWLFEYVLAELESAFSESYGKYFDDEAKKAVRNMVYTIWKYNSLSWKTRSLTIGDEDYLLTELFVSDAFAPLVAPKSACLKDPACDIDFVDHDAYKHELDGVASKGYHLLDPIDMKSAIRRLAGMAKRNANMATEARALNDVRVDVKLSDVRNRVMFNWRCSPECEGLPFMVTIDFIKSDSLLASPQSVIDRIVQNIVDNVANGSKREA